MLSSISSNWVRLGLIGIGLILICLTATPAMAQTVCTSDPSGVESGGSADLSQICYNSTTYDLSISWDSSSIWTGSNTNLGCALYDSDGDGRINSMFCVRILSSPGGAVMAAGFPATYSCSDTKTDRCSSPVGPTPTGLSTCSLSTATTDPFGGSDTPTDLRAECSLDPTDFGGSVPTPVGVSAFNNNNPVSNPPDHFSHSVTASPSLAIVKTATPTTFTAAGQTIAYSYVVSNDGNTIMTTLSVTDDKIATVSCPALPVYGLTPGQSTTCTANYSTQLAEALAGSLTNIAYAVSGVTNSPTDSATITYTGPPLPILSTDKTISIWDPAMAGHYALPGNDIVYEISVTNTGAGNTDADTIVLIDEIPDDLTLYVDDLTDGNPLTVEFIEANTGFLPFNYSTDVGFSASATKPSDFSECNYPAGSGYNPLVTFICFNPKGTMGTGPSPAPSFSYKFRAQIN